MTECLHYPWSSVLLLEVNFISSKYVLQTLQQALKWVRKEKQNRLRKERKIHIEYSIKTTKGRKHVKDNRNKEWRKQRENSKNVIGNNPTMLIITLNVSDLNIPIKT